MKAKVRIIMPAYNAQRFIHSSIKSIQRQTMEDWELIVVDDGSTDGTAQIVQKIIDRRIRLIRQDNAGPESARQRGFDGCSTEYVARMDADDEMAPDRLGSQVKYLDSHPDVVAVGGQVMYLSEDGRRHGFASSWPLEHEDILKLLFAMKGAFCNPTIMCRRETQAQVKTTSRGGPGADVGFILQLGMLGRIANLPSVIHYMRIHGGSIQSARDHKGRIMRTLYAIECTKNASAGLPERSWDYFCREWSCRHVWVKLAEKHELLVAKFSRRTMWYRLNGPVFPYGVIYMVLLVILSPIRSMKYLLRRLRHL